ncbi:MAG: alpha-ketoglutarate-dependent dioxygenase AlkB [Deltaproteobacteria bacterium]|nr:alpha-ketoglutarate-dependent dioxygenase AlkB [Deltaproteobacteria bacterium]
MLLNVLLTTQGGTKMNFAQLPLLGRDKPAINATLSQAVRTDLGSGAWFDHLPGWVAGHQTLFCELADRLPWQAQQRAMYDRVVDVPRLVASVARDQLDLPIVERMARLLGDHYSYPIERVGFARYRDGQDSVAWHAETEMEHWDESIVALVSLGEPRRFMLRPRGGGASFGFNVGWGDLVVMGGSCQMHFEHCVPKQSQAGERISVAFRQARPTPRLGRWAGGPPARRQVSPPTFPSRIEPSVEQILRAG